MTDIAIRLNRIAGAADEIDRAAYDIRRQRDTLIAVSANLPDLGGSDEILAAHLRKQAATLVRSVDLIGKMAICLRMIANLYMQTDQKSAESRPHQNKGLWINVPFYPGDPDTGDVRHRFRLRFSPDDSRRERLRFVTVKEQRCRFVTVKEQKFRLISGPSPDYWKEVQKPIRFVFKDYKYYSANIEGKVRPDSIIKDAFKPCIGPDPRDLMNGSRVYRLVSGPAKPVAFMRTCMTSR